MQSDGISCSAPTVIGLSYLNDSVAVISTDAAKRSLRMPRPATVEAWLPDAIELMAQNGCSLREATMQLGIAITSEEALVIERRKSFNRAIWEARHRYFNDLASNPNWKKDTAIGKLMSLAQKLEDEGDHDKAAEVLFKAAKMAGWVGPESTVSVFGELSQRDLDAIRETVARDTRKGTARVN
jgi:hypothetical protein